MCTHMHTHAVLALSLLGLRAEPALLFAQVKVSSSFKQSGQRHCQVPPEPHPDSRPADRHPGQREASMT